MTNITMYQCAEDVQHVLDALSDKTAIKKAIGVGQGVAGAKIVMSPIQKIILKRLQRDGDLTANQICSRTGINPSSAKSSLRQMKQAGFLHISGFARGKTGRLSHVYRAGQGKDAEKPKPMPNALCCKRWRIKKKEKHDRPSH